MRHAIRSVWESNTKYALGLVEGVSAERMIAQPVAGVTMNHPAWVLSHLNVYAPIAAAMLRREPFEDPAEHRYGRKSKVVNDLNEYLTKDALIAEYTRVHGDALAALNSADERVFGEATPLERWRAVHPTVGDVVLMLMVKHESIHLGQLSAWRRAMGLAPV
ncbi:MAG: DinB family protein [Phycisphaerales bacterium]